jgi:hypothetical protein
MLFVSSNFYCLVAVSMLVMGHAAISENSAGVLSAFAIAISARREAGSLPILRSRSCSQRACARPASASRSHSAASAPPLLVAVAQHFSIDVAFDLLASFWLLGVLGMIAWSAWGVEGRNRPLEALTGE